MDYHKSFADKYLEAAMDLIESGTCYRIAASLLPQVIEKMLEYAAGLRHIYVKPSDSLSALWVTLYPGSLKQYIKLLDALEQMHLSTLYPNTDYSELSELDIELFLQKFNHVYQYILQDVAHLEAMDQRTSMFRRPGLPLTYTSVTAIERSDQLRSAYSELNHILLAGGNVLFVGSDPRKVLDAVKYTLLIQGHDFRFVSTTNPRFVEFPQMIIKDHEEFPHSFPQLVHCLSHVETAEHVSLATLAGSNKAGLISAMSLRDPEAGEDSFQLYVQKCKSLNLDLDVFDVVVLIKFDELDTTLQVLRS